MRALIAALVVALATPAMSGPAFARKRKPKKTAAQRDREGRAFELFQQARKDFVDRRFKDAADKLAEAYKLFPQPMIRFRHAEALENLRKVEEALRLYKKIANVKDRKIRDPVRSAIRRLEALLQQPVEVSIISGDVVGALIFIDGKPYGTTPALIKLSRGKHKLRVTKEGYEPFAVDDFEAKGIDTVKVEAVLKPFTGMVRVKVPSGNFTDTRVLIDGKLVPIADAMATETSSIAVPVGRHQLECARSGQPSYYRPFVIKAGSLLNLECAFGSKPPDEGGETNWVGVGLIIGGGVSLIAGGALIGSYFADVALADELGKDLVSNKQVIGGVLAGVGVAAIVTGAVLIALDDGGDESESDSVSLRPVPLLGPAAAGFSLNGSF